MPSPSPKPSWEIILRIPADLGYRVKQAHQKRNLKRFAWIVEALEEKCEREGVSAKPKPEKS